MAAGRALKAICSVSGRPRFREVRRVRRPLVERLGSGGAITRRYLFYGAGNHPIHRLLPCYGRGCNSMYR